ncbi:MAG: flagellar hook-length control protein FliK, partial [Synergistaceae bacterium]|nr:flagellar hook-length control protein FliK [Synergistaceae bacterium]
MTLAAIDGLPGGVIDTGSRGTGGIHPPVGGGTPSSRPSSQPSAYGLADGSLVEGLVTAKEGDIYQVKIGAQMMNARSTIPLFVGQRFRAVWDASSSPPILRLRQADMMVLARFAGKDHGVALALFSRGLPVDDESVRALRRQWAKVGGENSKLGALTELW